MKATSSLIGPNDPVGHSEERQEIGLGSGARRGDRQESVLYIEEESFEFVAGYTLHNDYSERSFQLERGGQWVKGKSADTFAPLGPFVATRDEIPNPNNLAMWLKVNNEIPAKQQTPWQ